MLLLLKHCLPFLGQLPHSIKQGKVLGGPSSIDPNGGRRASANQILRLWVISLLLLLSNLLLSSLLLRQHIALSRFQSLVVRSEILGLRHFDGETLQPNPTFKALPRRPSLGPRREL